MIIKSFQCLLMFVGLLFASGLQIREFTSDVGTNLTITCPGQRGKNIMWVRERRSNSALPRFSTLENGSLFLPDVIGDDSGIYTCYSGEDEDATVLHVKVRVRTAPPPLVNVTVLPSTILALLVWNVEDSGGYPIIRFTAEYRLDNDSDEWKAISPNHISPNSRQVEVYKLEPNTTYQFKIWATNSLGKGDVVEVKGTTLYIDSKQELVRHFLEGADKFDTRMWFLAVGIVMSTLVLLGLGTCLLLYHECRTPSGPEQQEVIELVPNIILNPGFDGNPYIPPDENSNNETPIRLNNNTVIQPRNQ